MNDTEDVFITIGDWGVSNAERGLSDTEEERACLFFFKQSYPSVVPIPKEREWDWIAVPTVPAGTPSTFLY